MKASFGNVDCPRFTLRYHLTLTHFRKVLERGENDVDASKERYCFHDNFIKALSLSLSLSVSFSLFLLAGVK